MPELPEVETNARNLRRYARGKRIVAVTPPPGRRELGGLAPKAFAARVAGHVVEEVTRRGKWILCRLDGGAGLGLHLGMTGKIAAARGDEELPRFTRAVFALDDGARVCFVDSRRFGKLFAAGYAQLLERPEIARVGPDALSEVSVEELARILAASRPHGEGGAARSDASLGRRQPLRHRGAVAGQDPPGEAGARAVGGAGARAAPRASAMR
jgi:formamidopyrimidine-DNA glycosylase